MSSRSIQLVNLFNDLNMNKIEELALAMIEYNDGDPKRIQHTTKVHAYASLIGRCEGLDDEMEY